MWGNHNEDLGVFPLPTKKNPENCDLVIYSFTSKRELILYYEKTSSKTLLPSLESPTLEQN
jgi:hypothetical protein